MVCSGMGHHVIGFLGAQILKWQARSLKANISVFCAALVLDVSGCQAWRCKLMSF